MDEAQRMIYIQIEKMLGYVPMGTRDLLSILTHPDVIAYTEELLRVAHTFD